MGVRFLSEGRTYHGLEQRFFAEAGNSVLEIGSRARSGVDRLDRLGDRAYVGMDIVAGPNVDVVGDVHEDSTLFPSRSLDGVFALSVFEHVLMPWKAAVEINRVLSTGGLVFIETHQTFPLHEVPWDDLRFSDTSWQGIFNSATGFEILATPLGETASVVPTVQHPNNRQVMLSDACMNVGVLAKKTAESTVDWQVPLSEVVNTQYPH